MASDQLFGSAKFTWTDSGAQEHILRVPLQKVRAAARSRSYVGESLDYSVREVTNIGQVYEIIARIRYEDDPEGLVELLLAGHKGLTITYDDGTNTFACKLIEPSSEALQLDEEVDHAVFKENAIEVRLRRTTGGKFVGMFS